MDQYAKQKMNLEFDDTIEYYWDNKYRTGMRTVDSIWDIGEMFQLLKIEKGVATGWAYIEEAHGPDGHSVDHTIKIDMIKNIERNEILDVVVRPLQIKIKEMLNSPHTKRGRAFIEKQISWAFEEE